MNVAANSFHSLMFSMICHACYLSVVMLYYEVPALYRYFSHPSGLCCCWLGDTNGLSCKIYFFSLVKG